MCNKISYESKGEAKKEIKTLRTFSKYRNKNKGNSPDKSKHLRPYECDICGHWHLTSLSVNIIRKFRR
jgi:hypothetical protein